MFQPSRETTRSFDDYINRHWEWGRNTFGPREERDEQGVIQHIKKEIAEIESNPKDLWEWIDLLILGMDGFIRAGGDKDMLLRMLFEKQKVNFARDWPDWRTAPKGTAIEHVRSPEEVAAKEAMLTTPVVDAEVAPRKKGKKPKDADLTIPVD
jgi:hypothetical protein